MGLVQTPRADGGRCSEILPGGGSSASDSLVPVAAHHGAGLPAHRPLTLPDPATEALGLLEGHVGTALVAVVELVGQAGQDVDAMVLAAAHRVVRERYGPWGVPMEQRPVLESR